MDTQQQIVNDDPFFDLADGFLKAAKSAAECGVTRPSNSNRRQPKQELVGLDFVFRRWNHLQKTMWGTISAVRNKMAEKEVRQNADLFRQGRETLTQMLAGDFSVRRRYILEHLLVFKGFLVDPETFSHLLSLNGDEEKEKLAVQLGKEDLDDLKAAHVAFKKGEAGERPMGFFTVAPTADISFGGYAENGKRYFAIKTSGLSPEAYDIARYLTRVIALAREDAGVESRIRDAWKGHYGLTRDGKTIPLEEIARTGAPGARVSSVHYKNRAMGTHCGHFIVRCLTGEETVERGVTLPVGHVAVVLSALRAGKDEEPGMFPLLARFAGAQFPAIKGVPQGGVAEVVLTFQPTPQAGREFVGISNQSSTKVDDWGHEVLKRALENERHHASRGSHTSAEAVPAVDWDAKAPQNVGERKKERRERAARMDAVAGRQPRKEKGGARKWRDPRL